MIEVILDRILDVAGNTDRDQLFLRLALEFGIGNEDREHAPGSADNVFRRDDRGTLVTHQLRV